MSASLVAHFSACWVGIFCPPEWHFVCQPGSTLFSASWVPHFVCQLGGTFCPPAGWHILSASWVVYFFWWVAHLVSQLGGTYCLAICWVVHAVRQFGGTFCRGTFCPTVGWPIWSACWVAHSWVAHFVRQLRTKERNNGKMVSKLAKKQN